MKLHHYGILFVIIAFVFLIITDYKINCYTVVAEEKEKLDLSFTCAIDDAVINLVEADGVSGLKINKERTVNDFYLSLFASLGIMDNAEKQERIRNYIPVMAVTCEDGYYIYYSDEYKGTDHYTNISKRWSEKMPYYYEDNNFIYRFTLTDILTIYDKHRLLDPSGEQTVFVLDYHDLKDDGMYLNFRINCPDSFLLKEEAFYLTRKECMIAKIEENLAYYCNHHNNIAKQYGITYNFSMPVADSSEWMRTIDNPSMIVMFQGYPFCNGVDTYNRFTVAGARIKKNKVYYLEQKDWYYLYHKADCPKLKQTGLIFLDEPYYTVLDCVNKGAYACSACCPEGVHVPDYIPKP